MARTLPWLVETLSTRKRQTNGVSSSRSSNAGRVIKRQRTSKQHRDEEDDISERARGGQTFRTPSTSPPPPPPPQEPMRSDGTDDAWIMVEDEFNSTAQAFTQHLHHAEYKRLKQEAAKKTVDVIGAISRPVDGRAKMSADLRIGKAQEERQHRAKLALVERKSKSTTAVEDNTDADMLDEADENLDGDGVSINDKTLSGLMMGTGTVSQLRKTKLTSLISGPKTNTRAAAGFKQQDTTASRRKGRALDYPGFDKDEESTRLAIHVTSSQSKSLDKPQDRSTKVSSDGPQRYESSPSKRRLEMQSLDRPHDQKDGTALPSRFSKSGLSETNTATRSKPLPSRPRDGGFAFDDFPSQRSPVKANTKADKRKTGQDNNKNKSKLEEIPTFLI